MILFNLLHKNLSKLSLGYSKNVREKTARGTNREMRIPSDCN